MNHDISATPNLELLGEAADWVLRLREGEGGPETQQELMRWRQRSAAHDEAWLRAEKVLGTFGNVPTDIGRDVMRSVNDSGRRRALRTLGLLVVAGPAGLLAWRAEPWATLTSDLATHTGERREIDLPDGTHLVINTASAVDIAFTSEARRLRLNRGEILVTTGRDAALQSRPFTVETGHGAVRALGTRFSVRQFDDEARVMVFEHAVEISTLRGNSLRVEAGHQCRFMANSMQSPQPVDASAASWERGMLAATSMRLDDVVAELSRYRRGFLRCDPAVADLQFSGALSLDDTEAALRLLTHNLPISISQVTPYWVTILPA